MGSFTWQNSFDSVFLVIRNVVFESRNRFRFATSYDLKRGKVFFCVKRDQGVLVRHHPSSRNNGSREPRAACLPLDT